MPIKKCTILPLKSKGLYPNMVANFLFVYKAPKINLSDLFYYMSYLSIDLLDFFLYSAWYYLEEHITIKNKTNKTKTRFFIVFIDCF